MLLSNLDPSNSLYNGRKMICKGFNKNVMDVERTSGHCATKHAFLPRIQFSPPKMEEYSFKFIRKQFSVYLYFAMTINKVQG